MCCAPQQSTDQGAVLGCLLKRPENALCTYHSKTHRPSSYLVWTHKHSIVVRVLNACCTVCNTRSPIRQTTSKQPVRPMGGVAVLMTARHRRCWRTKHTRVHHTLSTLIKLHANQCMMYARTQVMHTTKAGNMDSNQRPKTSRHMHRIHAAVTATLTADPSAAAA